MRAGNIFTALAAAAAVCIALTDAPAHWPITVEENLAIAADTAYWEGWPTAIPLTDGKIIIVYCDEYDPDSVLSA